MTDAESLCQALSLAETLPEPLLRRALAEPDLVAGETLRLLSEAGAGAELTPEQENLLFWGVHVLAHARDARLLEPLLRFLKQDEETVDAILGDAVTTTLARMVASLFDGRTDPLFALVLDSTVDDAVRQALLGACVYLTIEGRIDRGAMRDLLVRFDDAKAAVEDGMGWIGWEEAIAFLGLRELAPRAEAARRDKRITDEFSDAAWFKETLREAERKPDDRERLDPWNHGYLDDPITQLAWTREGYGMPAVNPFKDVGRNDPCPCGSGKKFKKCCLGKADQRDMSEIVSLLGKIPNR
ncbi:DUF1186 domain-containing protein [Methylobacterium sp. WL103]|uniref:DUF1186 domain-containing protein n=1 Tax=unclassified Methylobacterium TaxID=2615210 RepID=UPI0011CBCDBF|nr:MULTISPECIES: DUF1186 domain-containing protein [unclassified Methylobacterium]TXM76823.1 DUF1186 domain-containing protein [Methylobacterium sp. WL12]TXN02229.1 DUF1186 domain-containing protein [Methylobacterium sp. WL103]TXN13968.1 DUF1186 domain-containing protein [Methylobacterium sp. WL122]